MMIAGGSTRSNKNKKNHASATMVTSSSRTTLISAVGTQPEPSPPAAKRRFATVLAARGKDGRPSDLEFLLRSHCQKVRVVERLLGQAHLLIPKVAETTSSLAIRLYDDPKDIRVRGLEGQDVKGAKAEDDDDEDENNTLRTFFQSFQMAVVFIVLPQSQQRQEQLDDPQSLFHTAQRLIRRTIRGSNASACRSRAKNGANNGANNKENNIAAAVQPDKMARVCLVSSADMALHILGTIVEAISKRNLAVRYFEMQARKHYVPTIQDTTTTITTNSQGENHLQMVVGGRRTTTTTTTIPESSRSDAAEHIAEALRAWAERFDLPPGEINVLMSTLGSLGAMVRSAAAAAATTTTANTMDADLPLPPSPLQRGLQQQLEGIPVEDRTKRLLQAFFVGSTNSTASNHITHANDGNWTATHLQGEQTPSIFPSPAAAAAAASMPTASWEQCAADGNLNGPAFTSMMHTTQRPVFRGAASSFHSSHNRSFPISGNSNMVMAPAAAPGGSFAHPDGNIIGTRGATIGAPPRPPPLLQPQQRMAMTIIPRSLFGPPTNGPPLLPEHQLPQQRRPPFMPSCSYSSAPPPFPKF